jgi:DNA mismatch repair protein MutH
MSSPPSTGPAPPRTEAELLERAGRIAGCTLAELADVHDLEVPPDFRHAKGWVGRLIELCLGASAGNKPAPDFERLGVELKTIPIGADGLPRETTYVCRVPLADIEELSWETSRVYKKLRRVLWVPVAAVPDIPIGQRPVGQALLWSPEGEAGQALRDDWAAHTETIRLGFIDDLNASDGRFLQIRPKAAHSGKLTWAPGRDGGSILTLPRGYYLRREFTSQILEENYAW